MAKWQRIGEYLSALYLWDVQKQSGEVALLTSFICAFHFTFIYIALLHKTDAKKPLCINKQENNSANVESIMKQLQNSAIKQLDRRQKCHYSDQFSNTVDVLLR